jgi:hypothetical protein
MFEPLKKVFVSALIVAAIVGLMVAVMVLGEIASRFF